MIELILECFVSIVHGSFVTNGRYSLLLVKYDAPSTIITIPTVVIGIISDV